MYIPFLKEHDEKLALLTEKRKNIYLMHKSEMTASEIADKLGVSRQNISTTIKASEKKCVTNLLMEGAEKSLTLILL